MRTIGMLGGLLAAGLVVAATESCDRHAARRPRSHGAPATAVATAVPRDAVRAADATVAAWTSMDAARIKALYAPDITGFDISAGPLQTDRQSWDRAQEAYVGQKIDQAVTRERTLQSLGADAFVMSGTWDVKSSTLPANTGAIRCTDVFRREPDGDWKIVNEHCSAVPTGF